MPTSFNIFFGSISIIGVVNLNGVRPAKVVDVHHLNNLKEIKKMVIFEKQLRANRENAKKGGANTDD